jgi:hypothetical protein
LIRIAMWKPRIDGASTEEALLALMREYCSTWLASDVSQLPPCCQECLPASADDIAQLAVMFKQEDLKFAGSDEAQGLMHELAGVFGIAAEKLRNLRSPWRGLQS